MKTPIAFVALCCALLAACQMIEAPPESTYPGYRLDEPIALAPEETALLTDPVLNRTIELTFVGVQSDSRCPNSTTSAVLCAWSGAVEVEMMAAVDGKLEAFTLAGITDYDGVVEGSAESETDSTMWYVAGYDFVLVQVIPYPGDERPRPEEYVVTAIVARADQPAPTPTGSTASIEHLIDDNGVPMLCVSDRSMAEWAAGATEEEPYQFTPPLAEAALEDVHTADEVCAVLFGEGWRIGVIGDVEGMWAPVIPTDSRFLLWSEVSEAVVERQ